MLIYSSGNLTTLEAGQPVPPSETSANQVGPGFASVTIMNESPWGLSFVNANSGSFPITPWAVATIPVSPGDSWHISPQEPLFINGNYLMPPGVSSSQTQVAAQFSRVPTSYSIRELFTISATEITGTTQVAVDTSGGPVDVSGSVTVSSGTVDIGNTPAVTISSGTVDATLTGPVDINSGQTIITEVGSVTDIAIANTWTVTANNPTIPGTTWETLLAANSSRRGLLLYANWTGAGFAGIGISQTSFPNVVLYAGQYWEMPAPISTAIIYWIISGVFGAGSFGTNLVVTEIT